jgi:hypothetical protein
MYNRDRKMGIFLSAISVVALILSFVLYSTKPFVSHGIIVYQDFKLISL